MVFVKGCPPPKPCGQTGPYHAYHRVPAIIRGGILRPIGLQLLSSTQVCGGAVVFVNEQLANLIRDYCVMHIERKDCIAREGIKGVWPGPIQSQNVGDI